VIDGWAEEWEVGEIDANPTSVGMIGFIESGPGGRVRGGSVDDKSWSLNAQDGVLAERFPVQQQKTDMMNIPQGT